ncbi:MAG: hypothetical protein WBX15_19355 [Thermoanaerobaculia bacterium]
MRNGLRVVGVPLLCLLTAGCRISQPIEIPEEPGKPPHLNVAPPPSIPPVDVVAAEGSSAEMPVLLHRGLKEHGLAFEREWIRDHYGLVDFLSLSFGQRHNRVYDIWDIRLPAGQEKTIWFDVTEIWMETAGQPAPESGAPHR